MDYGKWYLAGGGLKQTSIQKGNKSWFIGWRNGITGKCLSLFWLKEETPPVIWFSSVLACEKWLQKCRSQGKVHDHVW